MIRFIKSPTGKYKLAYFIGDEVNLKDKKLMDTLVKEGYAEKVKPVKKVSK
jgi:hypothetical protein